MSLKSIKWLTTLDLENFISKFADNETKQAFLGVFPIDCLPSRKLVVHFPLLLIINTNASNLPGQHWKAVYISKQRHCEVFDSLALPVSLRLEQWMNEFSKRWSISKLTIQNPLSPTCGAYVLYYVMCRLKHNSMNSCVAPFTSDVAMNDVLIDKFLNQFFK